MTKVAEIVVGALGLLRVVDANEAPKAHDSQDAIAALNRMMARWEANGYSVGWSPMSIPDDDMPTPPEADDAIIYNLAVMLRPRYGVAIQPDVYQLAITLKSDVLADVFSANPILLERTPCGAGCYNTRTDGWDC